MQTHETANQATAQNLPAFEGILKLEIPVSFIHKAFMDTLPEDYKHKEILAHAVIGTAQTSGKLSYIYNALFGFPNGIDFEKGDIVVCTEEERRVKYDGKCEREDGTYILEGQNAKVSEGDGYRPDWRIREVEIGKCEVVDIDLYSDKKLKVKFMSDKRYSNEPEEVEMWVSHTKCKLWATANQVVSNAKKPASVAH